LSLFSQVGEGKVRGDHLPVLVSIFDQVFNIHDRFNQFFLCTLFCEKLHYNHSLGEGITQRFVVTLITMFIHFLTLHS